MKVTNALYIHIPFCSQICHYCDFAKTALFDDHKVDKYFSLLSHDFASEVNRLEQNHLKIHLDSIFLGGGTPGIFTDHLADLLAQTSQYWAENIEITLETNPENVTNEKLLFWKSIGINRISIGVQSFLDKGAKALTRSHRRETTLEAVDRATQVIPNTNIDLIYGWPEQTLLDWDNDLDTVLNLSVPHLSCYQLTYEKNTVFGRRLKRGKANEATDDILAEMYHIACAKLGDYDHEEVSNWSMNGSSCRHNWHYWRGDPFMGIGLGAHGYQPSTETGVRYEITRNLKKFIDRKEECRSLYTPNNDEWLLESIGSSLRTCEGSNIRKIEETTHKTFIISPVISRAIEERIAKIEDGYFILNENEWFRENSWALALADCFH